MKPSKNREKIRHSRFPFGAALFAVILAVTSAQAAEPFTGYNVIAINVRSRIATAGPIDSRQAAEPVGAIVDTNAVPAAPAEQPGYDLKGHSPQ